LTLQETKVISSLIKNKDMISIMSENMNSVLPTHADMWGDIWEYYQIHKEVVPLSVFKEMHPDFEYVDLDGKTLHYIAAQKEALAKIALEKMVSGIAKDLKSGATKPSVLLNHLAKRVAEEARSTGTSRTVDVRDTEHTVRHLEKVREQVLLHGGQVGIPFGFEEMDKNYPTGMAPGHLMFLLGYSGQFKSWVALKIVINAWLKGYPVLVINLEMTPEELRERILFLISEYSMDDLVRADVNPEDFRRWSTDFMEGKAEFNLVGTESYGEFSVDMIQAKIEQHKPALVLLDYTQLFSDRARSDDERLRAKKTARELKQLANASRTAILAVTAVTGKDKKDRLVAPSVAQVAFSSEIEYAANLAFAVHTHRNEDNEVQRTEIIARKSRHGDLFAFNVKTDFEKGTIDVIPDDDPDYLNTDDGQDYLDE
jgi:replicative DNA helicase